MFDQDKIKVALSKTGFPLENFVSRRFEERGWMILSNRYYVDDVDGKARELDLIAYNVFTAKDVELVMAVLISCKKDDENLWAFLTRGKPSKDPNHDWNPINHWTNYEPLKTYLQSDTWKPTYFSKSSGAARRLFSAERDVFARQQISKNKISPQNDKAMFESASGLMKAMVHEINSLPRNPESKRMYIFVPAVVAETTFVDAAYEEDATSIKEIDSIAQLTNYIVGKKYVSAIIHFVRRDRISEFVQTCDETFSETKEKLTKLISESFRAITSNKDVRDYFLGLMKRTLQWSIQRRSKRLRLASDVSISGLDYVNGQLEIEIDCQYSDYKILSADAELREEIRAWLKSKARYDGEFKLDCAVPF